MPRELVALLHAADPSSRDRAWTDFLDRYTPLLMHVCRSSGADYDATMDRYRYVIERLGHDDYDRLGKYASDARGQFTTWLVVVARRLCHDHHRQLYGRDRTGPEVTHKPQALDVRRRLVDLLAENTDPGQIAGPGSSPELEMRRGELALAVERAVSSLRPRDRLLIELRFEDDAPVREIARIMGYDSVFQVYRRLKRVLRHLRELLEGRGFDGPSP